MMRVCLRFLFLGIMLAYLIACNQPDEEMAVPEDMILIPSGEFTMGTDSDQANPDQHPAHTVSLSAFYINKYEVTNAQYEQFIIAGGYQEEKYWHPAGWQFVQDKDINQPIDFDRSNFSDPMQPIVGISWYEADAYARWIGKRLPTEAEWEKAGRGTDERIYPWGNEMDFTRLAYQANNFVRTMPVGSFPSGTSPFDVYDMAGNVWEWTADWYNTYPVAGKRKNPKGPSRGVQRVIRGGGWGANRLQMQSIYRASEMPRYRDFRIGFRCAKDAK